MEFYGVKTSISSTGVPVSLCFNYPNGRSLHRKIDEKEFWYTGERISNSGNLFGMDRFSAGSAKAITVTEGALDALSTYEMLGNYPVVSITSASSAKTECGAEFEYLNSFGKIYLCFDSDTPGQEATKAVAKLFDFNKVYIVSLEKKDANEYLQSNETDRFRKAWWAARRFMPEGILSSYSEFDTIIDEDGFKPSISYPFSTLQDMTYGIRTGELNLFTALEGVGKTEIFRAIEYHILKTTDENIGVIHLEESKSRTLKGLVGYEVRAPIHLPDRRIPDDEIKKSLRDITRRDDRLHIYSHYDSDDPDTILSTVRFLVGSCGCKRVFLDHLTQTVSGSQELDERRWLDYLSTKFSLMVGDLDFTLFVISHVNDDGLTRGSRYISKVADLWVHMDRDSESENEYERNLTKLTIKRKNRFAGRTGPCGRLVFNPETYTLSEEIALPS